MSVVTAIVVVRNGERELPATLEALAAQSRRPDALVIIDCASRDSSPEIARAVGPTDFVRVEHRLSFGDAVATVARSLPAPAPGDAYWLLPHDAAPEPGALAALLAELETSPSVGVVGPKLVRADNPDYVVEFGLTTSRFGTTVAIVHDELDQGQHDDMSDVLAVAPAGMLVRSSLWAELDGFDPGLPIVDDSLDFCVRARLAGHRVSVAPAARVRFGGGGIAGASEGEKWRQRISRARQTRTAQLHRRLSEAPALLVFAHWLTLLPLAIARSAWLLIAKQPGRIGGEFRAALAVAFGFGSIARSRRLQARSRSRSWSSLDSLRLGTAEMRRRRGIEREARLARARGDRHELRFFASGGGWTLAVAALVSLIVCIRFVTAHALVGGGLGLLSSSVPELWLNASYGWRDIGTGFVGPADPFAMVLAVFGSLSFWSPSFAIVALWLLAIPAAAMSAWFAAARLTDRGGIRASAAAFWALAPTLLAALSDGRPGAVIAHILLPLLMTTLLAAARSWTASASAALLMATIAASAPSLAPALLVGWLAALVASRRGFPRVVSIPVVTLVLFAPLALEQWRRGTPLGLLADPGFPVGGAPGSSGLMLLGFPTDTGWSTALGALGLGGVPPESVGFALFIPLLALALFGLWVRGSRFAAAALVLAVTGLGTALAAQQIQVASTGSQVIGLWTGSGLSVYWLGLVGAAIVGLRALGRWSRPVTALATVTLLALVAPTLSSLVLGGSAATAAPDREVPAYVAAESARIPDVTTLVIEPQSDGAVRAELQRNLGSTLDDQSTLAQTSLEVTEGQAKLAQLTGDLALTGGADPLPLLRELGVQFILVAPVNPEDSTATAARESAVAALAQKALLSPVGETQYGTLWTVAEDIAVVSPRVTTGGAFGALVLTMQILVVFSTILLALPTGVGAETRPTRVRRAQPSSDVEALSGESASAVETNDSVPAELPAFADQPLAAEVPPSADGDGDGDAGDEALPEASSSAAPIEHGLAAASEAESGVSAAADAAPHESEPDGLTDLDIAAAWFSQDSAPTAVDASPSEEHRD